MKIYIIDCGLGNINSITKCIESLGYEPEIAQIPEKLNDVDKIIFPGVGSFHKAMDNILKYGWYNILREKILSDNVHFLGICLGMQLLATTGHEYKKTSGLSIINGEVESLIYNGCKLTIPHIGWNNITFDQNNPLFKNIKHDTDFYFDHSYSLNKTNEDQIIATSNHGINIVAAINKEKIFGVQFHPEKSSNSGKQLLKNFLEL